MVVFAGLVQAEPMSFPANKTSLMDHSKIGCINLVRLIYCSFFSFPFLALREMTLLICLFGLDIVEKDVPEHSLKLATALLLSLSHVLVGLTVLKAIAGIEYSTGPEPLRVGTDTSSST